MSTFLRVHTVPTSNISTSIVHGFIEIAPYRSSRIQGTCDQVEEDTLIESIEIVSSPEVVPHSLFTEVISLFSNISE